MAAWQAPTQGMNGQSPEQEGEGVKQPDAVSELGGLSQPNSAFQQAASQAIYSSLPTQQGYDTTSSQSMFSHSPVPGQGLQQQLDAPYENMAAQGLPETAHAFYESLSSQAQQSVTQGMFTLQHMQQQQLLAPFDTMSLQSTSSQGQEVFDSLTGHVPGAFTGLGGQPVQQNILEGLARQQRVASYNNLIAQAQAQVQAQAHAQAQAQAAQAQVQAAQVQAHVEAVESAQRAHAAAGLINSLHAAAATPQPLNIGLDAAAAAQHNALLASLQQNAAAQGLEAAAVQHGVLPNGLQQRGSMNLEGLAPQHSGHGSMLGGVPHPHPVRLTSAVSANGSIAALSEISDQQEAAVVSQDGLLEARTTGFMKPPSLPQHLGPADVCSPPFSPPKNGNLREQRSSEIPGLSLSKIHSNEPLPDVVPGAMADKLRREIQRLSSETERLEKEVTRQKALREGERVEFAEAKERLKSSWAVDRDDFARVKEQLKKKNAEHHIQNGRLSQSLKESEASCRMLRELCLRSGVLVPPELMQSSSSLANASSLQSQLSQEPQAFPSKVAADAPNESPPPQSTAPLPPLPPAAQVAAAATVAAPATPAATVPPTASAAADAAAPVPAVVTGTPVPPVVVAPPVVATPPPPASAAANAATAMAASVIQQLESVTSVVNSGGGENSGSADQQGATEHTAKAAAAAANAAAALGQLAAALAGQAPMEPATIVAVPVQAVPVSQAADPAPAAPVEDPKPNGPAVTQTGAESAAKEVKAEALGLAGGSEKAPTVSEIAAGASGGASSSGEVHADGQKLAQAL